MNNCEPFAPWDDENEKPLVEFKSITKTYDGINAVDKISLDIYEKEFFALLGPSGCGKTTLLRMLAGFEAITEGIILLDGQDLARTPPNKRPINMMFQSYALFPHLSVYDNIAFGLKRSDMAKDEIDERVKTMLQLVQLSKLSSRKPHQISGGQRQRVALARSLAKAPKLLLLDEPLAALDKKLRQETQFELMDIQEKIGTTFIIVTHDQEEAMIVATRVAVMDYGKIIQVSPPSDIYENPNSKYVADFIGDVNLIEGKISKKNAEEYQISWADTMSPIVCHSKRDFEIGTECYFGIRPEKITISVDRPENADNLMCGKIIDIAYLGNISTYHLELAGGNKLKAETSNVRRIARRDLTWGDTAWLSWRNSAGIILTD